MRGRVRSVARVGIAAAVAMLLAGTAGHAAQCYPLDGSITLSSLQPLVGQPFTVAVQSSVTEPCPLGTLLTVTMSGSPPSTFSPVTKTAVCDANGIAQVGFDAPLVPGEYQMTATVTSGRYCSNELVLVFITRAEVDISVVSPRPELPPNTVYPEDDVEISAEGCDPAPPGNPGELVVFIFDEVSYEAFCRDADVGLFWNTDVVRRQPVFTGVATVIVKAPPPGVYRATVFFTRSYPNIPFLTSAITVIDPRDPSQPTTTTTPGPTTPTTPTSAPGPNTPTTTPGPNTPGTSVPPPPTQPRPPVTSVPRVGTSVLPTSTTFGLIALVTGGAMVLVARSRRRQRPAAGSGHSRLGEPFDPPSFPPPPPPI